MRMLSKIGRMVVDLAKRIDVLESELSAILQADDSLRTQINTLYKKVGYLECPKHVYKFTCKRNLNENPYSMIWSMFPLGMLPDNRFVFTCTECIKEIELKESELSAAQRRSLVTLGLLEKKAPVKK